MGVVFDILHLTVAALLAIIGVGYEREEECPPVHFEPAAYERVETGQSPAFETANFIEASEKCEAASHTAALPVL